MLFGNLIHADHEPQYSTNAFIVRILVNEAQEETQAPSSSHRPFTCEIRVGLHNRQDSSRHQCKCNDGIGLGERRRNFNELYDPWKKPDKT